MMKIALKMTAKLLGLWLVLAFFQPGLCAEEALFFGNSYTYGARVEGVEKHGGIPSLVQGIAESKGKKFSQEMVAVGGKNWTFHLGRPETGTALQEKKWDWVVLQDYSTEPTHVGDVGLFMKSGEEFFRKIRAEVPGATVVLYQTWARPAANQKLYAAESSKTTFANPDEMMGELAENYGALAARMKEVDPSARVLLAPVGEAFAMSLKKHPEIVLHGDDLHHASPEGLYLSALVLYATMYGDTPIGATNQFPHVTIDPAVAAKLQAVAAEVVGQGKGS